MKKLVWWIIAIVCAVVFVVVVKGLDEDNANTWLGQQVQVFKHAVHKTTNTVENAGNIVASGADALADKANDVVDNTADTVKDNVGDLGGKVNKVADDVKEKINDAAEDIKDEVVPEEELPPMPEEIPEGE